MLLAQKEGNTAVACSRAMPKLVFPSAIYRDSFLKALGEFQLEGRNLEWNMSRLMEDFSPLLNRFRMDALGLDLPPGFVPQVMYWLVEGDEYLGRVSLRFPLTDSLYQIGGNIGYEVRPTKRRNGYGRQLLEHGLLEAKKRGLLRALVTCDANNLASRRIIESAGGQYDTSLTLTSLPDERHYWFDLGHYHFKA